MGQGGERARARRDRRAHRQTGRRPDVRQAARHLRRQGEDPRRAPARRLRVQLLAGRAPRQGHLAPHHHGRLQDPDAHLGDRAGRRRPRVQRGQELGLERTQFPRLRPRRRSVPRRSVRGEALRRRHGRVHRARVRRRHQEVRGGPRRIRAPAGKEQLLLGEFILFSCCMGN